MLPLIDRTQRLPQPLASPSPDPGPIPRVDPHLQLAAYYLIADTHMDFGWFAPNVLVQRKNFVVLEEVRQKLAQDPAARFSLEATWMLDAYARQATPGQFESVKQLIQTGQMSVAPHFVLLDDRLAGERAQIYNVLVGRRVAAHYGVTPSTIFCAKDIFGLDAQTPQRERKLGNDMVFRARGDVPGLEDAIVHIWLGADRKSWIYDVRQAGGYGSGVRLGHKPVEASATIYSRPMDNPTEVRNGEAARVIAAYDTRYARAYQANGLAVGALYNGCDYERLQKDIGEVVAHLRQQFPGVDFRLATFAEYGELVRGLNPGQLTSYQGALFGEGAACIRDVDVTRIPTVKVPYVEAVQALAEAEALAALATSAGVMEPAQGYLTEAWKDILATGTHDYMSGSVTDYIMPELSFLLWGAKEKARRVSREAMGRMASGLEVRYNDLDIVGESYSLLNLSAYPQTGLVELPVPASLEPAPALRLRTGTGKTVPAQVKGEGAARRAMAVVGVPGLQGMQVTLEAAPETDVMAAPGQDHRIENETLAVEPRPGGLMVKKKPGQEHRVWFDLVRDRGDTYTVDALQQPPWDSRLAGSTRTVAVTRGSLVQELVLQVEIAVPQNLAADRLGLTGPESMMTVTLRASLAAGLDRLRLDITVNNPAVDDYMLRLLVNAGHGSGSALAKDNFMVQPVAPVTVTDDNWQVRNSYYGFDAGGVLAGEVALAGRGLFAHRVEAGGADLTLIKPIQRGIGYVSCNDLLKRKEPAAAHREAPLAQCHGEYTYPVYLSLNGDRMDENDLVRWSDEVLKGLIVGMEGVTLAGAPRVLEGNALVTGIKQPEDGSADLIYHVGNYGPHEAYLVFDRVAEPCLLNEEPLGVAPSQIVWLGPYEFGAVRVRK